MKKIIFFASFIFLLSSCNHSANETDSANVKAISGQYCYLDTYNGEPIKIDGKVVQQMIDSTILNFTIDGEQVKGSYNYIPAEKDRRIGNFTGELTNKNEIYGICTFSQEGEVTTTGLVIKMDDKEATVTVVEVNISKTEDNSIQPIEEPITIEKIDCN